MGVHAVMSDVWVLLGHYKRKPSELMGVYQNYERGKQALDALGFIGHYNEVALTRVAINREMQYVPKIRVSKGCLNAKLNRKGNSR